MFSLKYIKKVYSLCIFLSVFSIIFASDIYSDSWAVIIGINDYNNIKGLHYAVEDAQDMKNILDYYYEKYIEDDLLAGFVDYDFSPALLTETCSHYHHSLQECLAYLHKYKKKNSFKKSRRASRAI